MAPQRTCKPGAAHADWICRPNHVFPSLQSIVHAMPKTFYIIDGHAQIYRAYYAPFRDLTSPTGEPTRATFVFTQMLMNLVAQAQAGLFVHGDRQRR